MGRTSPAAHTGRGLVLCDPLITLVFLPVPAKQPFNVANVPLRMLALKVCVCVLNLHRCTPPPFCPSPCLLSLVLSSDFLPFDAYAFSPGLALPFLSAWCVPGGVLGASQALFP